MHLKQGTPEWLEDRKNYIGASDAPIIMQVSPWTTPYQLWQEKLSLSPKKEANFHQKRGVNLEDPARKLMEEMTGLFLVPATAVPHPEHSYIKANLDCIDPTGRHIGEIKSPGRKDHEIALSGNVPEKYYPQLQHQMEVCQVEENLYFSYFESYGVIVKVYRDDTYIKKMLQKHKEFWDCVQSFEAPELTLRDYETKIDPEWHFLAKRIWERNCQIKTLESEKDSDMEQLIAMSEGKSSSGGGIKLTKSICRGNVDYKKIPELRTVDLESYRKKPIEKWRISEC